MLFASGRKFVLLSRGAAVSSLVAGLSARREHAECEEEALRKVSSSLKLSSARKIADGVLSKGKEVGLLPLAVVVLDAGGKDVVVLREDDCGIMRCEIARGKANAALAMGMSSRRIRDRLKDRPTFVNALSGVSDGRFVPVPGGVLILKDGIAIGAVGVSGDTSDKDEMCAIAAINAIQGLSADPFEADPQWLKSSLGPHH